MNPKMTSVSYLLIAKETDYLKENTVETLESYLDTRDPKVGFLTTIFVYANSKEDILSSIESKIEELELELSEVDKTEEIAEADKILNQKKENLLIDLKTLFSQFDDLKQPIPGSVFRQKKNYLFGDTNAIFLSGEAPEESVNDMIKSIREEVEV